MISASPKIKDQAVSDWLADRAAALLDGNGVETRRINARQSLTQGKTAEDFEYMDLADALLIVFPLYIFCTPGLLTRFLQDYYGFVRTRPPGGKKAAVYAAVNCGFPEPDINLEAARVIKSFSGKIGADYRFSILIGSGGMILGTQGAPFMKKAMARIDGGIATMKNELLTGTREPKKDLEVRINFPRRLYFLIGDRSWISIAKKNGLKKKDMYARPYL